METSLVIITEFWASTYIQPLLTSWSKDFLYILDITVVMDLGNLWY